MQKPARVAESETAHPPLQETAHPDWLSALAGDKPLFTMRDNKCRRPFVKGPIPLQWIQQASRVGATELGLYIWWKVGLLSIGSTIALRPSELAKFGLGRYSTRRQYQALMAANLVRGVCEPGKCKAVKLALQGG